MTGMYGPIIFGTGYGGNDFQDMRKSVSARWLSHEVHASKPLLEYGGPQLIEIQFRMKWCLPISGDPTQTIFILQEIMDLAVPLPLVMGMFPMGRGSSLFVMTELSWNPNYFFRDGAMIAADADVHLKEYVDSVSPSSLFSALGGLGGGIMGSIGSIAGGLGGIAGAIPGLGGIAGGIAGLASTISGVTSFATGLAGNISGLVSGLPSILPNAVGAAIPSALTNVESTASTIVNNPLGAGSPTPLKLGFGAVPGPPSSVT